METLSLPQHGLGSDTTIDGNPTIYTTWLLTSEQVIENNWNSTLIGKDEFTKISNSPEKELGLVDTKKTELYNSQLYVTLRHEQLVTL